MIKLKNSLWFTLTGVCILCVIHSCEQVDEKNENFVNPYEIIGSIHNLGLSDLIKNFGSNPDGLTIDELSLATTDFLLNYEENGTSFKINDGNTFKQFERLVIDEMISKKKIDTAAIFTEGTESNRYYELLISTFSDIDKNDTLKTFRKINKIEEEIWNSTISSREKTMLLMAASVGKSSYSFWKNRLSKTSKNSKSSAVEDSLIMYLLISDVQGSIGGFIVGAIGGAIGGTVLMPGVGTITAAILAGMQGGVWGAIIGSAVAFFFEILSFT